MRRSNSGKSIENVVRIGSTEQALPYGLLFEYCVNQFKNKGLSLRKGCKKIGISHKTFLELKKASQGLPFTLGEQSLWKITQFQLKAKKGRRKIDGVMPAVGKCIPFI